MLRDYLYTAAKFHEALVVLATRNDDIRQRLYDAYRSCATLNPDNEDDFPNDELRERFRRLEADLTKLKDTKIGPLRHTIFKSQIKTVRRHAGELLSIAVGTLEAVARADERQNKRKPR